MDLATKKPNTHTHTHAHTRSPQTVMDLIKPSDTQCAHIMFKNVHEMLAVRGYDIDEECTQISLHDFVERFGKHPNKRQMTLLYEKRESTDTRSTMSAGEEDADDGPIVVVFSAERRNIGVGAVRELVQLMHDCDSQNAILIVQNGVTAAANTALRQLAAQVRIQIFPENEMLCISDIVHHERGKLYSVLTKAEKTDLLSRYGCKDVSKLPRILQQDPIVRYYGLRRGQVLKIVRPSETAGRYTNYRCVF